MVERYLAGEQPLWIRTLYGADTREPYVEIQLGECRAQLPVTQARMVTAWMAEATEAATQDAFLVEWMMEQFELPIPQAAQILQEYRRWRENRPH